MAAVALDLRNRRTGAIMIVVALAMLALGYASVPLYRMFCEATGFGGTPARATEAEAREVKAVGRTIAVRFDANVDRQLKWMFRPQQRAETVPLGERRLAIFIARNDSDRVITGQASFNVEPEQAASYFKKIQCFCFTQQTLQPGQQVSMPVVFYVDPKISGDPDARDVDVVTLSYTFHEVAAANPLDRPAAGG